MTWVLLGLGNPDEEYARTRHNVGRMAIQKCAEKNDLSEWKEDKKSRSFVSRGRIGSVLVLAVVPNTYMNKSGSAALHYVKGVKAAEKLIVVYDDLDLPLGTIKISFDRGSGGHKGVESIARALKTKRFVRIRAGISPEGGKPHGEKEVERFILGDFSKNDLATLARIFKKVNEAIETILTEGRERAMNIFN